MGNRPCEVFGIGAGLPVLLFRFGHRIGELRSLCDLGGNGCVSFIFRHALAMPQPRTGDQGRR